MAAIREQITIYTHAGCNDGLFAAYIVARANPGSEVVPIVHDKPYEVKKDGQLIFVDVCPSLDVLKDIAKRKQSVKVFDHHISNKPIIEAANELGLGLIFDNDACGAKIAFRQYKPNVSGLEQLIDYVDDRDRWVWAQPNSRAIVEAILFNVENLYLTDTQEQIQNKFIKIDWLLTISRQDLLLQGNVLLEHSSRLIKQLVDGSSLNWFLLDGKLYRVAMCETRLYRSEVGNELIKKHEVDFSICWSYGIEANEYWLSLRSADDRADVNEVSQKMGGGGHRNAAGCTIKGLPNMIMKMRLDQRLSNQEIIRAIERRQASPSATNT